MIQMFSGLFQNNSEAFGNRFRNGSNSLKLNFFSKLVPVILLIWKYLFEDLEISKFELEILSQMSFELIKKNVYGKKYFMLVIQNKIQIFHSICNIFYNFL